MCAAYFRFYKIITGFGTEFTYLALNNLAIWRKDAEAFINKVGIVKLHLFDIYVQQGKHIKKVILC